MRNPKQKKFCHFQFHPSHPPSHSLSPFPHLHPFKEPSFHLLPTSSPLVLPPFISCLPTLPPNKRHVPSPLHHVSRLPNTRRNARVRALARGGSRSPPGRPEVEVARLGPIPLRQCHELEEHRHPLQLPEAPLQRRARRRPEAHHRLDGHRGRGWATTSGGTWPRTWWRIKWRTKWVECC